LVLSPEFVDAVGRSDAKRIEADIGRWAASWSLPALGRDLTLRVNLRLRTSIARYRHDASCIEVGPRFLADRRIRREAIAHELAHAAVAKQKNRRYRPHGPEWCSLLRQAGFSSRAVICSASNETTGAKTGRSGRFVHRCPVCQMTRTARRPIAAWRCRQCVESGLSGRLDITTVIRHE
jgi:predicted SprT family Zn-dependent metalloprotease